MKRWLPMLAGLLMLALCVRLGFWQLDRAAFKRDLQAHIDAPLAASDILRSNELAPWQRVRVRGEWVAGQSVLLDNRLRNKQPGYEVLSVLSLANDGGLVMVNRGWVAAGLHRDSLPQVVLQPGPVELVARVREPDLHGFRLDDGSDSGAVWQRADPTLFAARLGRPVARFMLQQESELPDGLQRDWPPLESGEDKHRAYALQWFAFALTCLGLMLWQAWRMLKRKEAS